MIEGILFIIGEEEGQCESLKSYGHFKCIFLSMTWNLFPV